MNRPSPAALDPLEVLELAISALNSPAAELPFRDVERALQIVPHDARLWHVQGLMHRLEDRRERAIPSLQRAVHLAPNEPLIAHGYARTLLEAGFPAVDAFARALQLARQDPAVLSGLVAAMAAQGKVHDAIEGLSQALRRSPLWTDGHVLLSSMRWSNGERRGFTRSYDEALQAHPNSLELRREQLVALVEAKQFDEALQRVEEGRRLFGEHVLFASHEAAIHSESGNLAAADPLFDALAELDASNIEVWHVRHRLRAGQPERAIGIMDRWLPTADQNLFWHYAASAWRMVSDPRSHWLEGDQRFVQTYDIVHRLPPLDELANTLRRLHVSRSEFFSQSVRGGTQTDGHLFQRIEPEIIKMREAIRDTVSEYAQQLPPIDPAHPLLRFRPSRVRFAGAWSVRLAAGGMHSNHVHPMGWLSSALYVTLPPDLGQDKAGWLVLGESQAELGINLPPHREIAPAAGTLALFPSWMWHGTRSFGEGERMTVAFDVARDQQLH